MNSTQKKILSLFIGLLILFLPKYPVFFNNGTENELSIPKQSAGFLESFIHVDGNWSATVSTYAWCSGEGSWGNPYVIENVSIDASNSPTGSGILIENSKNDYFIIRNCTVYNAGSSSYDAGIRLQNTCNGTINDNNCSNNELYGIFLYLSCNNNSLSGNTANNNTQFGIYLQRDCHQNKVINNTANSNKEGIKLDWWGFPGCSYNSIINNTANNNSEIGIHSHICTQSNITGNTVNDNGKRGIFIEGADLNNIINNTANRNGIAGISIYNNADDNTLTNNTSTENTNYGIEVYNSDNNEILNNTVNRNGHTGIYLSWGGADYNNITGNIVNDNVKIGIYLYQGSDNNKIKNNTIKRNNLGIGLKVSNSNFVFDNSLIDNGACIFELGSTGNIIENNTCSGSFKPEPIFIDGTATGVGAHNWTWVEQQSWFGGGSGTKAVPYIIEDIERDGFAMISSIEIINSDVYFIVRNCTFYNSGSQEAGITLNNVGNGTLINNNCSFNRIGISLDGDCNFNNITGNTANFNDQNGISLGNNCDFNNIMGNSANNNTHHGIYLDDHCDNNTISQNTASYNGGTGMHLFGGGGIGSCYNNTISGNTVNDNNYGLRIEGACHFNKILRNTIKGNNFGISLDDSECSNNSLYNNVFLENGQHAIDEGTDNNWNSTTIGNYWDNHTAPDTSPIDGIVDNPYTYIGGSAGSIDYLPIAEDGVPEIEINSPTPGSVFGVSAPSFIVMITDTLLESMWYSLDGGLHNYVFTENSTIDQLAWSALQEGSVTITFYANDTVGNEASEEVIITKSIPPPKDDPTIVIVIVVVFTVGGVAVLAVVYIFMKKRATTE